MQVFRWTPGQHNVIELGSASCAEAAGNAAMLFDVTAEQPAVVKLESTGDRFFACGLPSHCEDGMLLTVHTTEAGTAVKANNTGARLCSQMTGEEWEHGLSDEGLQVTHRTGWRIGSGGARGAVMRRQRQTRPACRL